MSAHIPLTPQDLASGKKDFKGLQKLKYYCQLCKKQCLDKNGFKCHMESNTHLMHMRLFAENPDKYVENYSKDFEEGYLDLLKKRYEGKQVLANKVYQDYIACKTHTHMNATKWTALTSFVEYLVETGKVESEWTDKGLFIQYLDTSTESLAKKKEEEKKLAAKLKKEEKEKQALDAQIELANKIFEQSKKEGLDNPEEPPAPVELDKDHQQISFSFSGLNKAAANPFKKAAVVNKSPLQLNQIISIDLNKTLDRLDSNDVQEANKDGKRKGPSGIEKVLENAKAKKLKTEAFPASSKGGQGNKEPEDSEPFSWVTENIIVKIKDESLQKYNNQKGKIIRVVEPFVAEVEMLSNNAKLQIDQDFLETVIPKIGNNVKVLKKGPFYGKVAVLESIHQDNFTASVHIQELDVALELPYELICKVA